MKVLGIHDGHNASACLYADGEVQIALQEERLRRVKNWSGMPTQAVEWILKESRLRIDHIDWIAFNGHHAAYPQTRDELMHEYRHINHSIGNIYAMVTYLMGMVPLEHEYKLMGLAPYAEPKGADQVFEALVKLVRFDPAVPLGWARDGAPGAGRH